MGVNAWAAKYSSMSQGMGFLLTRSCFLSIAVMLLQSIILNEYHVTMKLISSRGSKTVLFLLEFALVPKSLCTTKLVYSTMLMLVIMLVQLTTPFFSRGMALMSLEKTIG